MKKVYALVCKWNNVGKAKDGIYARLFESLPDAKAELRSAYNSNKADMEEGGGYYDSFENNIYINDDGMSYEQHGLMETTVEIMECEIKPASKKPKKPKNK